MSSHSSAAMRVSGWSLRNCSVSMLTVSRTSKGSSSIYVSTIGNTGCWANWIEMPASCFCSGWTGDWGRVRTALMAEGNSLAAGVTGSETAAGGDGLILRVEPFAFGTPPLSNGSLAVKKPDIRSGDSPVRPAVPCGDDPAWLGLLVTAVNGTAAGSGAGATTCRGSP
jgi:hypothetical protein